MYRLTDDDLPGWGELLARWSVWCDERGPLWARCDAKGAPLPITLQEDCDPEKLRVAVLEYEEKNGVQESAQPPWMDFRQRLTRG